MRIRTIKPEFWQHDEISALHAETTLLAIGLLNYADDEGYFRANPKLIESTLFPLRKLSRNITGMLLELSNMGYIKVGKSKVDGKEYGFVIHFTKHQVISHPYPSKIKDLCDFTEHSSNNTGTIPEHSEVEQGTGNREMEQGKRKKEPPPLTYPLALDTDTFRTAFNDYLTYRVEAKKGALLPRSQQERLNELAPFGQEIAIAALRASIANGWTGVFPERIKADRQQPSFRPNQPQQSERERLQGVLRDNQYPNTDPVAEATRKALVAETTAKLKALPL